MLRLNVRELRDYALRKPRPVEDVNEAWENNQLAAKPKYKNCKTTIGGVAFDSRLEARRYVTLRQLEDLGVISDLKTQVRFELAPAVRIPGAKKMSPPLRYFADFVYTQDGKTVIEDAKGDITEVYRIKRHLMAVLGFHIVEIRKDRSRARKP